MKKNQLVKVYEFPLTSEGFEGEARLVRKEDIKAHPGFEYWQVRFDNETRTCFRLVKIQ
jgi:hypothetical protein